MNFAEAADGAEIAWTSEGEGEPMLLIAGQATAMDGWGPTAELLSRYYRVIRFDHRGIGRSGKGEASATRRGSSRRMQQLSLTLQEWI